MEFEIIHGSRLSTVSLSYRTLIEVVSDLIKFLSTGTYAVNYLIFCSCVVFVII